MDIIGMAIQVGGSVICSSNFIFNFNTAETVGVNGIKNYPDGLYLHII
jgi:hypothetical protein